LWYRFTSDLIKESLGGVSGTNLWADTILISDKNKEVFYAVRTLHFGTKLYNDQRNALVFKFEPQTSAVPAVV
jgi:hypothetical protein